MGREEERRLKKLQGKKKKTANIDLNQLLSPRQIGDSLVIPIVQDNSKGPVNTTIGPISAKELMHQTQNFSDSEMNRLMVAKAKYQIEHGLMPPWPEDDHGVVMWFTWNFVTPEMREAFLAIAKDYLDHYKEDDKALLEFEDMH